MPIDARIPLMADTRIQMPQIQSPMEVMGQGLQMKAMQQNVQKGEMEMQAMQAQQEQIRKIGEILQSADMSTPEGEQKTLQQIGSMGEIGMKYVSNFYDMKGKQAGLQKTVAEIGKLDAETREKFISQSAENDLALAEEYRQLSERIGPEQALQVVQTKDAKNDYELKKRYPNLDIPSEPWTPDAGMAALQIKAMGPKEYYKMLQDKARLDETKRGHDIQVRGQDVTASTGRYGHELRFASEQGFMPVEAGIEAPGLPGGSGAAPSVTPQTDVVQVLTDFDSLATKHGANISSLLRSPERNKKVGGVPSSAHLSARGGDFNNFPSKEAKKAFMAEARSMGYKVIDEGDHVHLEPAGRKKIKSKVERDIETKRATESPLKPKDIRTEMNKRLEPLEEVEAQVAKAKSLLASDTAASDEQLRALLTDIFNNQRATNLLYQANTNFGGFADKMVGVFTRFVGGKYSEEQKAQIRSMINDMENSYLGPARQGIEDYYGGLAGKAGVDPSLVEQPRFYDSVTPDVEQEADAFLATEPPQ